MAARRLATTAALASKGAPPFEHQNWKRKKSGSCVDPMNVPKGTDCKSSQGQSGKVGTSCRLHCICGESATAGRFGSPSLEPSKDWHHDQGSNRYSDARAARLRLIATHKRHNSRYRDHTGQNKKAKSPPNERHDLW
jgi:hypothetical protein